MSAAALNLTGSMTSRTLSDVIVEARALLNDPVGMTGTTLSGTRTTRTVGGLVAEVRGLLNDPQGSAGPSLSGTTTTRTLGSLVAKSRDMLNDTCTPFRYSDENLIGYVADALLQVRRYRPDLFTGGVLDGLPAYTAANAGVLFPIAEEYYPAFIQYIVAAAELRDDPFTIDGKVALLSEGFIKGLTTAPYRHSDSQLYGYVGDALLQARTLRPDLFVAGGDNLPAYDVSRPSDPFPLAEGLYPAFTQYVFGMARARDDVTVGAALVEAAIKAISGAPARYSDARMYGYVSNALSEARRVRPDLFMDFGLRRALPVFAATDQALPFPLDERYFVAFVSYVVAMSQARDDALKTDAPGTPMNPLTAFVRGMAS